MSKDASKSEETVELYLPKFDSEDTLAKGLDDVWERFPTTIDKIIGWFRQYQVDSIELWISGVMETGGITRLVCQCKRRGWDEGSIKAKG